MVQVLQSKHINALARFPHLHRVPVLRKWRHYRKVFFAGFYRTVHTPTTKQNYSLWSINDIHWKQLVFYVKSDDNQRTKSTEVFNADIDCLFVVFHHFRAFVTHLEMSNNTHLSFLKSYMYTCHIKKKCFLSSCQVFRTFVSSIRKCYFIFRNKVCSNYTALLNLNLITNISDFKCTNWDVEIVRFGTSLLKGM